MGQYKAALVTTGAINETFRDKIYQELGLELLAGKIWCQKVLFRKTIQ